MISRGWIAFAILMMGAFGAVSAGAERRVQTVPPGADVQRQGGPSRVAAACTLGVMRTPDNLVEIFPTDDTFYLRLNRTNCFPCTTAVLGAVYVTLNFPLPCSIPAEVSVVRSTGGDCPVPDLFGVNPTILGPYAVDLSTSDKGLNEFMIPLPSEWKVSEDAFLAISFPTEPEGCSAPGELPSIAVTNFCASCSAYQGFGGTVVNMCQGTFAVGSPVMSAEVSECLTTPNTSHSWGMVKVRYR
jgi:hypothetical protein